MRLAAEAMKDGCTLEGGFKFWGCVMWVKSEKLATPLSFKILH
jgi:hypothetical protein